MDALRCLDCGDVRWSLMGLKSTTATCTMCGGDMVAERRRPAAMPVAVSPVERRDLVGAPDRHRPRA